MKIAYDSQAFSMQKYGGISRYFSEVASRISKQQDITVTITAPMYINAYLQGVPPDIVSGFRMPNIRRFSMMFRIFGMLLSDGMLRVQRPDIIHETYFFPFRLGPSNVKRVITIHDMIHEKFSSSFKPTDKASKYKALAAKRADHIICVSESTKRDAIEILGLPSEKISVIHHGFNLMNNASPKSENSHLASGAPFLLYVGARKGYKNFLRLLTVFQKSKKIKNTYNLICFGGGAFSEKELKTMHKLGVDIKNIIQLEGDDMLLSTCYKNAVAFIYPSLYEGFGIPPLEAMSHDCPVVCSETSSIPEVVGDAGEYFDPYCNESMLASIEKVVYSEAYQKELIKKGRERLKNFSWSECAKKTLDVYKSLFLK